MRNVTTWTGRLLGATYTVIVSTVLAVAVVIGISAIDTLAQKAPSADEAGVRRALEAYLQGHATGQGDHFWKAMHTDMRMSFVRDGNGEWKIVDKIFDRQVRTPASPSAAAR